MDMLSSPPDTVPLADAKAKLSALVDRAEQGASVTITRHGRPVAKLVPYHAPRKPIDWAMIHKLHEGMPIQPPSEKNFVEQMRDEDERF